MLSIWLNKICEFVILAFGFYIISGLMVFPIVGSILCAKQSLNSNKTFKDVWNDSFEKKENNNINISRFLEIIIALVFATTFLYGNKDIKSIFKRCSFDFQGYVYAFPNSHNAKSYRLKADLTSDNILFYQKFRLEKIYFNNGGYIDFTDKYGELDDKGTLACGYYEDDNEDKEWCFRFYGEQIKDKK